MLKRMPYRLIGVEAGRPLESAQSERKSTTRYGDKPLSFKKSLKLLTQNYKKEWFFRI
ncbi:hypothetical protein [Lysinibacillus sp. G4S2]|uniref:hypothetical protein n=1 Tax=Lysinibacillus sp. G4S2 TaxID=3055859 RepID=UPI0025A2327D|nr:hypothetical protein [Lysinibacillus sp. G4S2]MDM5250408.1 hypothetical protein [Lysinibacillus sp. G4S2]